MKKMVESEGCRQLTSSLFLVTEIQLRDDNVAWTPLVLFGKEGEEYVYSQEEPVDSPNEELEYSIADVELLEQMVALGFPTSFGTSSETTKCRSVKKPINATSRKDLKGKALKTRLESLSGDDVTDPCHADRDGDEYEIKNLDAHHNFPETSSNNVQEAHALWEPIWDQHYQRYYFYNVESLETSWEPPEFLSEGKLEAVSNVSLGSVGCTENLEAEKVGSEESENLAANIQPGLLSCDYKINDRINLEAQLRIECKNSLDFETTEDVRYTHDASTTSEDFSTLRHSVSKVEHRLCNSVKKIQTNADGLAFESSLEYSSLHKSKLMNNIRKDSDVDSVLMEHETALAFKEQYQSGIASDEAIKHERKSAELSNLPAWGGSHVRFEDSDEDSLEAKTCEIESQAMPRSDQNSSLDTQPSTNGTPTTVSSAIGSLTIKSKKKKKKKKLKIYRTVETSEKILFSGMFETTSEHLLKYWYQRYHLFSKFDKGIKMDEEALFSVTPEIIARHHAFRCATDVIVDAFTGVGGNAIQFALRSNFVIAIDIDPKKIDYAKHNAEIYGVSHKIEFVVGDFLKLAPSLKADVVFLSPPWGGPAYINVNVYDLQTMLQPKDGFALFKIAQEIAPSVVLFLPRNVNFTQLAELSWLCSPPLACEVEKNCVNDRLKAITAYYGPVATVQNV